MKLRYEEMEIQSFYQYLEFEKRYSPHTLVAYQNDLEQFFEYLNLTYEMTNPQKVAHYHIRAWIVDMVGNDITPRSINRKLSTLKTYFKFLLKRKSIEANPMLKVVAPKVGKKLPVFVVEEKMEDLFSKIEFSDDYEGVRDRAILEMLYSTGMRRAELIDLKTMDVDFYEGRIKVMGKGAKERLIPFAKQLKGVMRRYFELRGETFPECTTPNMFLTAKGKKLYPKLVYNIVHKYLSMVTTVEKRSPHVLRHSFATHLSNNGADLNAIKELLGHANLAATQVYTHNSIEKLKEVYQQAHPKAKVDKDKM